MAYKNSTYLVLIVLIEVGLSIEGDIQILDKGVNEYEKQDNKTETFDGEIYNTTYIDTSKTINIIVNDGHHKKCEALNTTVSDDLEHIESNTLDSVYLNNIHSSLTSNLIEDNLSVSTLNVEGFNLFDVVNSDCGGATVCPSVSGNWSNDKTITVGFLGAYGRSQVSFHSIFIFVTSKTLISVSNLMTELFPVFFW